MNPEIITTFLSGYLHSLREETRDEKTGNKYGFDHVILKLAEADNLIPLRLAFHRGGRKSAPRPKKEAEHGEDLKVISQDGKKLVVFVLKDEPLTYRNWTRHKFDTDIRRAAAQDMTLPAMAAVVEVKLILAYNKDDDEEGGEEFQRLARSFPTRLGDSATLVFERWNLTELTSRVKDKLIGSPTLLPEKFFRQFSYICWQVQDFHHGSDQWREVLIPDWREFLANVLKDPVGEKEVRMVSIALMILEAHAKDDPSWEAGWIELIEYAALALFAAARKTSSKKLTAVISASWGSLYLSQLEEYYRRNAVLLGTTDSLAGGHHRNFPEVVSSHHAYWHMGRLGILALGLMEIGNGLKKAADKEAVLERISGVYVILTSMIRANTSCFRPMLDCHHLQIFLLWRLFSLAGRQADVVHVFSEIYHRLLQRRVNNHGARLIDQQNSWSDYLEYLATGEEPSERFGRSSFLLQMILEICVFDLGPEGVELAEHVYTNLIEGKKPGGESWRFPETVELQSWVPSEDWADAVLSGYAGDKGICITIQSYDAFGQFVDTSLSAKIQEFVSETKDAHPFEAPVGVPFSALVLACMVHNSPLPPGYWRMA